MKIGVSRADGCFTENSLAGVLKRGCGMVNGSRKFQVKAGFGLPARRVLDEQEVSYLEI